MDAADWVIAGIAVLSLVVAVWSVLDGRASAHRAWLEARRGADAQAESVDMQRNDAARPGWRVERQKGSTFRLVNDSSETEYAVRIAGEGIPRLDFDGPQDIGPGSAVTFFAVGHSNAIAAIRVTSHRLPDLSDPERAWSHPLPP